MVIDLKRSMDITGASIGIILLLPVFILIGILIAITSKGPVFMKHVRVGLNMEDFHLLKFRTTFLKTLNTNILITENEKDHVTNLGRYLRKYRLDKLPHLINILRGEMSFVGPKPELRKFVNLYTEQQKYVLSVKPGIIDAASLEIFNEKELLAKADDPDSFYIKNIIPQKLNYNLRYIAHHNIDTDIKIILSTLKKNLIN